MIDLHDDPSRHPTEDLELNPGGATPTLTRKPISRSVLVAGLLVLIAGFVAWFIVVRGPGRQNAAPAGASTVPAPTAPAQGALGTTPADVTVPPLDESDSVVRELVRQLSSHPTVAAWLATDGLIRNFTVSLANVADGVTPERHLRTLRPTGAFAVTSQGEHLVIDPASYRRYDNIAAAVSSIDAAGAAQLYTTLKPRIAEAYRDLGHPDTPVDQAVEQAIVSLLRTPIPSGPVVVQPGQRGIGYVYADARLESLSAAQKQLLRMGPVNARTIQRSLRAIAIALGISEARLPQPTTT
jgi:hypothetical protein